MRTLAVVGVLFSLSPEALARGGQVAPSVFGAIVLGGALLTVVYIIGNVAQRRSWAKPIAMLGFIALALWSLVEWFG